MPVILCHVIDPNRPVNVIDDELLPYVLAVGLPQLKGLKVLCAFYKSLLDPSSSNSAIMKQLRKNSGTSIGPT
jgi:hypothetical protein